MHPLPPQTATPLTLKNLYEPGDRNSHIFANPLRILDAHFASLQRGRRRNRRKRKRFIYLGQTAIPSSFFYFQSCIHVESSLTTTSSVTIIAGFIVSVRDLWNRLSEILRHLCGEPRENDLRHGTVCSSIFRLFLCPLCVQGREDQGKEEGLYTCRPSHLSPRRHETVSHVLAR